MADVTVKRHRGVRGDLRRRLPPRARRARRELVRHRGDGPAARTSPTTPITTRPTTTRRRSTRVLSGRATLRVGGEGGEDYELEPGDLGAGRPGGEAQDHHRRRAGASARGRRLAGRGLPAPEFTEEGAPDPVGQQARASRASSWATSGTGRGRRRAAAPLRRRARRRRSTSARRRGPAPPGCPKSLSRARSAAAASWSATAISVAASSRPRASARPRQSSSGPRRRSRSRRRPDPGARGARSCRRPRPPGRSAGSEPSSARIRAPTRRGRAAAASTSPSPGTFDASMPAFAQTQPALVSTISTLALGAHDAPRLGQDQLTRRGSLPSVERQVARPLARAHAGQRRDSPLGLRDGLLRDDDHVVVAEREAGGAGGGDDQVAEPRLPRRSPAGRRARRSRARRSCSAHGPVELGQRLGRRRGALRLAQRSAAGERRRGRRGCRGRAPATRSGSVATSNARRARRGRGGARRCPGPNAGPIASAGASSSAVGAGAVAVGDHGHAAGGHPLQGVVELGRVEQRAVARAAAPSTRRRAPAPG